MSSTWKDEGCVGTRIWFYTYIRWLLLIWCARVEKNRQFDLFWINCVDKFDIYLIKRPVFFSSQMRKVFSASIWYKYHGEKGGRNMAWYPYHDNRLIRDALNLPYLHLEALYPTSSLPTHCHNQAKSWLVCGQGKIHKLIS